MPAREAPCVELGSAPETPSIIASPSPSEISSASSPEPQNIRAPPLFRVLAMPPPEPIQPPGQEELERRFPGYQRIVIPRELTLIELLKQYSGVTSDEEVLSIREAKLRVVAERVGLRRLHILAPLLRSLTLDGSAISSLRDLGIGLVRLKFLSVNRCGLTSLDGILGLGRLRELHAAANRLQDLQPLAALQKLHTLNLSDNPITESSPLWTLAVCSSLRCLTLRGTPASTASTYRTRIASALPMLVYLDDRPLHNDVDYDLESVLGDMSSSSESDNEDEKPELTIATPHAEPEPGPSASSALVELPQVERAEGDKQSDPNAVAFSELRRRPATTEGVIGLRAARPRLPIRPHTAHTAGRLKPLTKLEIMNSLMDEEWRCSGSTLTSRGAVCGNLAQALRRPSTSHQRRTDLSQADKDIAEQTVKDAARALASEIPRAPCLEEWAKFRKETGINIDIDFINKRPEGADPLKAIERLEQIERETKDRLEREDRENRSTDSGESSVSAVRVGEATAVCTTEMFIADDLCNDYEMWREIEGLAPVSDPTGDIDAIFNNATAIRTDSDTRRRPRHYVSNQIN